MCVVAAHGLAAVVTLAEETTSLPSVSSLLAYEKVVETIHAGQTVIPLRYGCLVDSQRDVVRMLEDHRQEYEALLCRLEGMTEIGIRVLWPARAGFVPAMPLTPGAAYVASLRNRYASAGSLTLEEAQRADRITRLLSGCYTEQRREVSTSSQGRLLSLYFLTRKTCVERFWNEARRISPPSGAKLLLSGPWPPYNFVMSPG